MKIKAFADTMIFGYSAMAKLERHAKIQPGTIRGIDGSTRETTVVTFDTNVRQPKLLDSLQISSYIDDIKSIAEMAKNKKISIVHSHEVDLELLFQPDIDIYPGRLFGAPVGIIHSPLLSEDALPKENGGEGLYIHHPSEQFYQYRSAIMNMPENAEDILREFLLYIPVGHIGFRMDFRYFLAELRKTIPNSQKIPNAAKLLLPLLKSINDPRYLSLCRAFNAQESPNTLLDAYHVWTAEVASCDYFLTTENKIIENYTGKHMKAISPRDFLSTQVSN